MYSYAIQSHNNSQDYKGSDNIINHCCCDHPCVSPLLAASFRESTHTRVPPSRG